METKTDFYTWLNKLNYDTFKKVRNELRMSLGISGTTFTNWYEGTHTPNQMYHSKINEITLKYSNIKFF